MKKQFLFLLLAVILLSSCATATLSEFPGVGRVKQYDFYSYDIPPAFDGFRIGFASDFHYESRFKRSELNSAVRALKSMHADVLLLKKLKTNLHGKRKQGKIKISMIVQPIKSKQVW